MIIIYSCIGVVLLGVIISILRSVDWYSVFASRYGNNPLKAKVYVDYGQNEVFYDGWYIGSDDKWFFYEYVIEKRLHTVLVPVTWLPNFTFVRGRVKICVDFGNEYAKPLVAGDMYPSSMGSETLNTMIDKRLALEMAKSIKSRKGMNIGLFIIVAVVVVGGFLFWRSQSSKPAEIPPSINPPITTTIPAGDIDDIDKQLKELMEGK